MRGLLLLALPSVTLLVGLVAGSCGAVEATEFDPGLGACASDADCLEWSGGELDHCGFGDAGGGETCCRTGSTKCACYADLSCDADLSCYTYGEALGTATDDYCNLPGLEPFLGPSQEPAEIIDG